MEKIIQWQLMLYAMTAAGLVGVAGLLVTNFTYKRMLKHESHLTNTKDRWLLLCRRKDRLIHRMNRFVWYPALASTCFLLLENLFWKLAKEYGRLPGIYVYAGIGIPLGLLILRMALDISYKEEQALQSLADYVENPGKQFGAGPELVSSGKEVRKEKRISLKAAKAAKAAERGEEKPERRTNPGEQRSVGLSQQEQQVFDQITEGIRQSAAADSRFKKMLTPEETEIMKEIIREFMN